MPVAIYYGVVIGYPFISTGVAILTGQATSVWRTIKNEFFLWFGITILYVGIIFILLSIIRAGVPGYIDLIAYTAFYFSLSLVRKFWITGSTDIFDKTKEIKLVQGKQ